MPIFEYECQECGKITEVLEMSEADQPDKCECGGELKKLISQGSFILTGTGWYKTDYQDKPQKKNNTPS
jgi:putative FmdB family regulatory protein